MKTRFLALMLVSLGSIFLSSCGANSTDNATTQTPTPILEPMQLDAQGKAPGIYCFEGKESNLALNGTLTYSEGSMAEGYLKGVTIDPDNGNEAVFNVSFKGSFKQDTLYLAVISDEFTAKTSSNEKWLWKDKTLYPNQHRLSETACK